MIAVIMAADDSKKRNADAVTLLNYGFGKCQKYEEPGVPELTAVNVKRGESEKLKIAQEKPFTYVDVSGRDLTKIERSAEIPKSVKAPVKQGEKIGKIIYKIEDEIIGEIPVLATETIREINYMKSIIKTFQKLLLQK